MPHIFVKLVSRLLLFANVLPKEDIREIRVIRVRKNFRNFSKKMTYTPKKIMPNLNYSPGVLSLVSGYRGRRDYHVSAKH